MKPLTSAQQREFEPHHLLGGLPMTHDDLASVREGDVLRNVGSGDAYVVVHASGRKIAVRSVEVSNPSEWTLVLRVTIP